MFDLAPIGRARGGASGALRDKPAPTPDVPSPATTATATATVKPSSAVTEPAPDAPPGCRPVLVCHVGPGISPVAPLMIGGAGAALVAAAIYAYRRGWTVSACA